MTNNILKGSMIVIHNGIRQNTGGQTSLTCSVVNSRCEGDTDFRKFLIEKILKRISSVEKVSSTILCPQ